jgi:NAD(P)-dependent dehydrogenase (short-subunit alcohol dehydrogenase family)
MQRRMEDLSGRVAVVIGGGSGIGRGIALGLATEGMRVVVADIDAGSAEGVRDEIAVAGGPAVVRGIRSDRLHFLTHPASRSLVEARHAALVEDFMFFAET